MLELEDHHQQKKTFNCCDNTVDLGCLDLMSSPFYYHYFFAEKIRLWSFYAVVELCNKCCNYFPYFRDDFNKDLLNFGFKLFP